MKSEKSKMLVIAPWLEGGGAQKALAALMRSAPETQYHVVTLFEGCKNFEEIRDLATEFTCFDLPRNLLGSIKASRRLKPLLKSHGRIYSLMRGSHVVLGLIPRLKTHVGELAASIHQLPSSEGDGIRARVEEYALKRTTKTACLVTAPSKRAIAEFELRHYCRKDRAVYDPNILIADSRPLTAPREGELETLRLLFGGRLTRQKGLDQVPDIFRDISHSIDLRIIGDGPERQHLSASYNDLPPNVKVTFCSHVDDIIPHIDWADAIFMPSRSELNPMFLHEAWGRGRGAIVSNIEAFRDLKDEGPLHTAATTEEYVELISKYGLDFNMRDQAYKHGIHLARSKRSSHGALMNYFRGERF